MNQIKLKRIGSQIAQELSTICATEAHDSLLKAITITNVEVTNDLGLAKVYFTTLDNTEPNILEKQLNDETAGYLRTKIADRIEIRHTPKIRFTYDKSIEYGNKIERLLNEIHEKDGE
jgi:ribosome-binding factor A